MENASSKAGLFGDEKKENSLLKTDPSTKPYCFVAMGRKH